MRSMVCKSYRVWFNSLIKVTRTRSGVATKAEDAAVYTLPASIWELEQQVATESNFASRLNLKHTISLHSFELDTATSSNRIILALLCCPKSACILISSFHIGTLLFAPTRMLKGIFLRGTISAACQQRTSWTLYLTAKILLTIAWCS